MALWHLWTEGLVDAMSWLAGPLGLSQACAIILLTLGARLALMPLSLATAVRAHRNRRRMERLKPVLTLAVGLLTGAAMMLAPEASSQSLILPMVVLSCLVAVGTLAGMPSAVGLYWATSNAFSIGQSLVLRLLVRREHHAGLRA